MLKILKYPMVLLALLVLAACPEKGSASPPIVTNALSEAVAVDSFKVTASFTMADPTKAAYTVKWRVTVKDSVGGATLGSQDVTVGTTATFRLAHTLVPGGRFTVGVSAQGMNQNNELNAAGATLYAGFTAIVGAPSPANPVTVTICKIGDPGC